MDEALKARLYPIVRQAAQTRPLLMVTHDPAEPAALGAQTLRLSGPPLAVLD